VPIRPKARSAILAARFLTGRWKAAGEAADLLEKFRAPIPAMVTDY